MRRGGRHLQLLLLLLLLLHQLVVMGTLAGQLL
jgi:hypothetical protein